MEITRQEGECVEYDAHGGRIVAVTPAGRNEIHVRPQVHRLVGFMAERNAASAGGPVLCTHDELMTAVWGDEPMHTSTELARLFWELRRALEPLGATDVVVNERGRGYRLVTCADAASIASGTDGGISEPTSPSRRHRWALAAVIMLRVAVDVVAVLVTRNPEGSTTTTLAPTDAGIGTFVDRIENVLEQSAAGRREIRSALNAGFSCSISPDEAARRISSVADNRQSILEQLGSLQTPTPETDKIVTSLQRALQQSIEADRHYRDGFLEVQAGTRCPVPSNPSFDLASKSDEIATAAKRRFVAAFNSFAREHGRPTWSASGF